jgi:hypothetical protein
VILGHLIGGLLIALVSAAAINIGFLLQQRGLLQVDGPSGQVMLIWRALRNRTWLCGQALGWAGFGAQMIAVAIAPLALVQAFAAGGLALSVPAAAGLFGHRISRVQAGAVLLTAAGLALLPVAAASGGDQHHGALLLVAIGVVAPIGVVAGLIRSAAAKAIAAGMLYGVADAAIKAISVNWTSHGAGALLSGWTALAAAGTFGGFLAFQAALRAGGAISAISLMNALAALAALAFGVVGFSESLGRGAGSTVGHLFAVGIVLACVPFLAAAHTAFGERDDTARRPSPSPKPRSGERESASPPRDRRPRTEERALQPRSQSRRMAEQDLAEANVASHRERSL